MTEQTPSPTLVGTELRALEPSFHRSPPGSDRSVFEQMTTPDFFEVGASGRVHQRDFVLDTVAERYAAGIDEPQFTVREFAVRHLSGESWLATYELTQDGRRTRRAKIWTRTGSAWRADYHQGTLV
ncbi:DUF4440 domain-containing protein [Gordonia iterans]|uniref:DUF4440 domain-containing protein n=1 Tax=Gordonia iterans TaxID=1004901 RepID=A0A2S0KFB0_9ACTN|nr:DUF4440 domain-containing protein [Gordonia iterans]AVM00365.1 DUF4440 domain-containing protein [Gordonia iterans]